MAHQRPNAKMLITLMSCLLGMQALIVLAHPIDPEVKSSLPQALHDPRPSEERDFSRILSERSSHAPPPRSRLSPGAIAAIAIGGATFAIAITIILRVKFGNKRSLQSPFMTAATRMSQSVSRLVHTGASTVVDDENHLLAGGRPDASASPTTGASHGHKKTSHHHSSPFGKKSRHCDPSTESHRLVNFDPKAGAQSAAMQAHGSHGTSSKRHAEAKHRPSRDQPSISDNKKKHIVSRSDHSSSKRTKPGTQKDLERHRASSVYSRPYHSSKGQNRKSQKRPSAAAFVHPSSDPRRRGYVELSGSKPLPPIPARAGSAQRSIEQHGRHPGRGLTAIEVELDRLRQATQHLRHLENLYPTEEDDRSFADRRDSYIHRRAKTANAPPKRKGKQIELSTPIPPLSFRPIAEESHLSSEDHARIDDWRRAPAEPPDNMSAPASDFRQSLGATSLQVHRDSQPEIMTMPMEADLDLDARRKQTQEWAEGVPPATPHVVQPIHDRQPSTTSTDFAQTATSEQKVEETYRDSTPRASQGFVAPQRQAGAARSLSRKAARLPMLSIPSPQRSHPALWTARPPHPSRQLTSTSQSTVTTWQSPLRRETDYSEASPTTTITTAPTSIAPTSIAPHHSASVSSATTLKPAEEHKHSAASQHPRHSVPELDSTAIALRIPPPPPIPPSPQEQQSQAAQMEKIIEMLRRQSSIRTRRATMKGGESSRRESVSVDGRMPDRPGSEFWEAMRVAGLMPSRTRAASADGGEERYALRREGAEWE